MAEAKFYSGIDVSKKWLDIVIQPTDRTWRVQNDMEGISTLTQQLKAIGSQRIVVEATGGYETRLVEELCKANLAISHVNPLRVRRYAEGMNWFAKTDKIDSRVLANFGEKANPRLTVLPGEVEKRLAALLKRRKPVMDMLTAERNRLENLDPDIREYIQSIIATLKGQLAELDSEIDQLTKNTPQINKRKLC